MREVGASREAGREPSRVGQVQEKAGEAAQQVREKAKPALGPAREKAQELRGQAGSRLRQQVDTRSTDTGEQVRSVAGAVRTTSEQFRSQGQERPAKVAEQAAERAERLGGYLVESDADRILGDVQDFARRQPWLVAALGAALGFLTARFVKASSGGGQGETNGQPFPSRMYEGPRAGAPVADERAAPLTAPPPDPGIAPY